MTETLCHTLKSIHLCKLVSRLQCLGQKWRTFFFFCGPVARLISKDICQSDTLPENRSRCSTGELNEVFYVVRMLQTSSVLNPTIFFSEMLS